MGPAVLLLTKKRILETIMSRNDFFTKVKELAILDIEEFFVPISENYNAPFMSIPNILLMKIQFRFHSSIFKNRLKGRIFILFYCYFKNFGVHDFLTCAAYLCSVAVQVGLA